LPVVSMLFVVATNAVAKAAEMRMSPLPKRRNNRIRFG
jgi:hypothetical protein